jgi:hypothetical protein
MRHLAIACVLGLATAAIATGAQACGYKTQSVSIETPTKTVQLPQTKVPSAGG